MGPYFTHRQSLEILAHEGHQMQLLTIGHWQSAGICSYLPLFRWTILRCSVCVSRCPDRMEAYSHVVHSVSLPWFFLFCCLTLPAPSLLLHGIPSLVNCLHLYPFLRLCFWGRASWHSCTTHPGIWGSSYWFVKQADKNKILASIDAHMKQTDLGKPSQLSSPL